MEKEVPSSILRQSEEIDEFFFDVVCMFQRGGCPRGKRDYIRPPEKEGEFLTIDGDPVYEEDHLFEEGMYFSVFYCLFLLTIDQQIFWRDS